MGIIKSTTQLSGLISKRSLRQRMEAMRPRLYRLAWSWCHDNALAEDLVQDSLLKALQNLPRLREPERLEPWLCRIMANRHRDHLRARRKHEPLDEQMAEERMSPERGANQHMQVQRVRSAVNKLPEEQRKVLTLVDLMEMSYAEVARTLDIPTGTVMSRLSRARSALRLLLEKNDLPAANRHLRSIK